MSQSDKEIQSQLHNYLTIACNYRFDVLVTLISGEKFKGQAFATGTNEQKQNCFIIQSVKGKQSIATNRISTLTAITENPHFHKVNFRA